MPRPLQRHGHRQNPQDEAEFHLDSLYRQAFCYVAKPEGTPVTFCGAPTGSQLGAKIAPAMAGLGLFGPKSAIAVAMPIVTASLLQILD